MSFVVLWRFDVGDQERERFERIYGPDGEWAALFRRSPDYLGTELFRDTHASERYLTIDRWKSAAAYDSFRRVFADAYAALDAHCARLTSAEQRFGAFEAAEAT